MKCNINLDELATLESLLSKIEALPEGTTSGELLLPRRVSFQRRLASGVFIEAVALDRLLQKGLVPLQAERTPEGKMLALGRQAPTNPQVLRTEPPPIDIVQRIPALAPLAKPTIRLHPRRAVLSDLAASKFGGTFLWPRSESWPRCDDRRHQTGGISPTLVGLVQLNAVDFPQLPFRPGTDLLQLLWCPTIEEVHDDACLFPKLFAYWRNSREIIDPVAALPLPDVMETVNNYYPISCRFFPEIVQELPNPAGMYHLPNHRELHDALTADEEVWYQSQSELSACPSTKLGGHPYWIQNDDTPTCACGEQMDFLLQLCDWEYTNMNESRRWIPLADRWAVDEWQTNPAAQSILRPPLFDFGGTVFYIFVCRNCPEWPVRLVDQR